MCQLEVIQVGLQCLACLEHIQFTFYEEKKQDAGTFYANIGMKVSKIFKECCFKCHYGNGIDNNTISDNAFDKSLNVFGKNLKRCVCLDRNSNLNKK